MIDNPSSPHPWYRRMVSPISIESAAVLLRVWLGAMMITHGFGKVFGDNSKFFAGVEKMGFPLPEFFGWAAALSEFAGGIFLILGLFTRFWSLMALATMAVAGFIRHADDPFNNKELAFTYLVISGVVFLLGPGRASLDRLLFGGNRG